MDLTQPSLLNQIPSWTNELERKVSCPAEKDIINSLQLTTEQAISLEEEMQDQSACKKVVQGQKAQLPHARY